MHENELLRWYFLAFKFRSIFFLPLRKYRLAVDIFVFHLGMLIIELCNRFPNQQRYEGGSVFLWLCIANHVKRTVLQ